MAEQPWRKRIRLPAGAYAEAGSVWHVTVGTRDRSAGVFANAELARAVVEAIEERCRVRGTRLEVYCLMPDHCHLVVQIVGANLVDVIGDVKSRTTRVWWGYGGTGALWQRSFYDHGVRTGRDYETTVRYVIENPVRAGLVADWTAYPFIGGAAVEMEDEVGVPSS
jgi:REP element-mobilizing transposase RayT